ncbi:MAG: deoxynucleoside kinase [Reichenbachiella sp.]
MSSNPKHIAIAGNIGAGKTTLAKKLGEHLGWRLELEDVEFNPYLARFYEDMPRWAFHLQVYFLNSRFRQVSDIIKNHSSVIQDRTIYEDNHIFAKCLHQRQQMTTQDFETYSALFDLMIPHVKPPDLLIYLKSDLNTLVRNINKRGRSYEESIDLDYLAQLNDNYENWINDYKLGDILILDINDIDFVKNEEDLDFILEKIKEKARQTEIEF